MSYLDINNLYKDKNILLFKKCHALEKIHGTSAHISFSREYKVEFVPEGVNGMETIENIPNTFRYMIRFFYLMCSPKRELSIWVMSSKR